MNYPLYLVIGIFNIGLGIGLMAHSSLIGVLNLLVGSIFIGLSFSNNELRLQSFTSVSKN